MKKLRIIILAVFQSSGLFHPAAEVTMINVGQGDSILIRMPLGRENILIDTGKPSEEEILRSFLYAKGIHKISTLIITHGDDDHDGNRQMIIDTFHPDIIAESGYTEYPLKSLHMYNLNTVESDDPNTGSMIQYFSLNRLTFLLMADADLESEKQILQKYPGLTCNILKLGHHGSATSSGDSFLDHVRPEIALISSGSYSIYHHPHPDVIQRLLKRHIPYFDTKTEGDISFFFFPFFNLMISSAGKITVLS